jgi:kanamycin nucleotidyltransferase
MWSGPQPQNRADRLQIVDRIVADLHRTHGDAIKAMALYGSLSRGTDGEYSDVELWCVLSPPGVDTSEEWVYGPSKAEVDFYGEDVMRARAVEVDSMWSLQQGALINCRPLFGDRAYFTELRELVMSPPKKVFDNVIAEMVVGEFFEWMGKLRNGIARNDLAFLPITTCNFTLHLALMAALLHRHIYSTSSTLMNEALALPTLPAGYAELAGMVMAGNLHDKAKVAAAIEATWAGLGPWLAQHGIEFDKRNAWPWA